MISIGEDVEKLEPSHTAGRNVKWCSHFGKKSCRYSFKQWNGDLPYGPAISLLGIHSKAIKAYVHATPCTWMFTAAFLIIAKKYKQPKRPSTEEWISKLCSSYTTEYYSAIKNKSSTDTHYNMDGSWKHYTKPRSLTQEVIHCVIPYIWNVQNK